MFDASLMPEDFRPSHFFEKEVLLNFSEASRREEPAKKYFPICNSNKDRRKLMCKNSKRARDAEAPAGPRAGKRNCRPAMGRLH